MRVLNFLQKTIVFFSVSSVILFCGKELPLEELKNAKLTISRATKLNAEKYSKEKYDLAKASLLKAHENINNDKLQDASNSTKEAIAKGLDAIEESLPKLCDDTKKEAEESIKTAEESFADELASDNFKEAKNYLAEGDAFKQKGEDDIKAYPNEQNKPKKDMLRETGLDKYENAYYKYLSAKVSANESKDIALAQKSKILNSLSDIDANLNKAEKYADDEQKKSITDAKNELTEIKNLIQNDKLKEAYQKVEPTRKKSNELLLLALKSYAEKRKILAGEKISSSKEKVSALDNETIQSDESLKKSLSALNDNLKAADEALTSATELYNQEKFEDSIKRSDEAIRLADISLDQIASINSKVSQLLLARQQDKDAKEKAEREAKEKAEKDALAKKQAEDNKQTTTKTEEKKEVVTEENYDNWTRYKVKKRIPPDCLWRIAGFREFYGDPLLWKRIFIANKGKIKNPNLIYPGQILLIPPKKGAIVPKKNEKKTQEQPKAVSTDEKKTDSETTEDELD